MKTCASRHSSYALKVRKHKDGDWIVYGKRACAYGSEDYNERESLKSGADVSAAIRRTGKNCQMPDRIVRACIADLPAEQLETDAPALAGTQRRDRLRKADAAKKVFVVHGHDEAAREGTPPGRTSYLSWGISSDGLAAHMWLRW